MDMELDHLGIIVRSIEREIPVYVSMGYEVEGEIFQDDNQMMRGLFLKSPHSARVELIEDLSESRSLTKILGTQCGKIYHMAFKVKNL